MASVHFGRLGGPAGFSRVVAIKRLHSNFAKDPEFVTMFLEEARLAARIRHLNVVSTLDVVASDGEVFLVMDYVHGQSLANLWRAMRTQKKVIDPRIVAAVMSGVCHGLHAAHEARGERGEPLRIVHRDVSPQNILVGVDGVARVLDFGVAKASGRVQTTSEGRIKGKLAYMPPEQLHGATVTRRTDVYAAAVVTWELLTGQRAFGRPNEAAVITAILEEPLLPPSQVAPHVPPEFDAVVMRALDHNPHRRHATAQELANDLERCVGIASMSEVGAWVCSGAQEDLSRRMHRMSFLDGSGPRSSQSSLPRSLTPSDVPTKPTSPAHAVPAVEVSGVSRVAISRLVQPSHRRAVAIGSGALVCLLGVVLITRALLGGGAQLAPEPAPETMRVAGAREAPVLSTAPWTSTRTVPDAIATPVAVSGSTAPVARSVPAARAAGAAAVRAQAKKRDCDPPFTIEANGHKRYKATCLD